ncbi:twin-arginine translocation signal domain-containing protein [Nostoc commune]
MSRINGFLGRRDFLKFASLVGIAATAFGDSFWNTEFRKI